MSNIVNLLGSKYIIVNNKEKFASFLSEFKSFNRFCFDFECTSLATHSAEEQLVGLGIGHSPDRIFYIPFNCPGLTQAEIIEGIRDVFEDDLIGKIGHNIKFDSRLLHRFGITIRGIYFDTMVASYALHGDTMKHGLDDLSLHYLNHVKIRTKTLIPKKSKSNPNPSMLDSPIEKVAVYCCEDVEYTLKLYYIFSLLLDLKENQHCHKLFYEVDMPLVPVLTRMECQGVHIDEPKLDLIRQDIEKQLSDLQTEINTQASRDISLTNPGDISKLLFEELKVDEEFNEEVPETASGKLSTSKSTLAMFKDNAIVNKIIEYKKYAKILSVYVLGTKNAISRHTGLLHPFFGQTSTATARLNSSNPNCQNYPSRTPEGKRMREVFTSRFPGGKILSVDYSQAELRILAHLGDERIFLDAYNRDEDVHKAVASEVVFDIPREQISKEQRDQVKTVNFALLYGARAKKLAETLGVSPPEAQKIIDKYMKKMSGLKSFLDTARDELHELGYTANYFGRRRYIPGIYSKDKFEMWSAEREGANNKIQSTNADMIRIAMIRVDELLQCYNYKSKLILQVHDELVFDLHPDEIDIIPNKVKEIMESVVKFKLLMKAEGKIGDNWSQAH